MRTRALVLSLVVGALSLILLTSASALPRPPLVERKLDLRSAQPLSSDAIVIEQPGAGVGGSATGSGSPPRIGDNIIVNAPQVGQFSGLVGRNETSITLHGQNLVAGWNDAAGFCGIPILLPPPNCTGPESGAEWHLRLRLFDRRRTKLDGRRRATRIRRDLHER